MGLGSSIAGVISGIANHGGVAAPDLSGLFNTINAAGENQKELIAALPVELQKQYQQYMASNAATNAALGTGTQTAENNLLTGTEATFDPAVAQAAEDAAKTKIYAAVPGQQDAIREALAATGGFDRGTAAKQLAQPVLQAAGATAQNVLNTEAQQLQAKQQATQAALTRIASMDENMLQQQFGMNKQQATEILTGNRQDLKDQLTNLINQSVNQTNQTLAVEGINANNQYKTDVANKAQNDAFNNSLINLGVDGATAVAAPGFLSGLNEQSGYAAPSGASSDLFPGQTL